MSEDENEAELSAFQRLNRMGAARGTVGFDKATLDEGLWRIAQAHYMCDEDLALIASLSSALNGTHPDVQVAVEQVPEGVTPRKLAGWQREGKANNVADFIDMQVADGTKQEAAIQEAMSRFAVSRREAFRMLKEVRAIRPQWAAFAEYEDYTTLEDGRLVPKQKSG